MTTFAFDYFEHDADIGIFGRGPTLAAAFIGAAQAMFAIMAEPAEVGETLAIRFGFSEADPEFALVTWLNRLLTEARLHGAVFCRFALEIKGTHYFASAWGAPWKEIASRGTEVKGATLTALAVRQIPDGWEARCVVDV